MGSLFSSPLPESLPPPSLPAFLTAADNALHISADTTGQRITLSLSPDGLVVQLDLSKDGVPPTGTTPSGTVPYLFVLSAKVEKRELSISLLWDPTKQSAEGAEEGKLVLWRVEADVSAIGPDALDAWVGELHRRAYDGVQPHRRFLVLVNPHGGQGKALEIWNTIVSPIFLAAGCSVTLQLTGPSSSPSNATSLARALDLSLYDALVPISGDGITSELMNGLAGRDDALFALRSSPVAPIPGGSGNALSVNIVGPRRVGDPAFAAVNAIKGTPIPLDLCTVSQGERTTYSFLSQAFGLVADLDLGTEWMRWMGDTRFLLGFLWGILTRKTYWIELSLKLVESDKATHVASYNASSSSSLFNLLPSSLTSSDGPFPPLRFGTSTSPLPSAATTLEELSHELSPGWHTFRLPVQLLYGGKLPWVSRGSMQFPLARDDGLIDLVLAGRRGVMDSLKAIEGGERGAFLSAPSSYYYKVEAYRCTPLARKGYISIDGESIPHEAFQVENHPRLARVLSVHGRWHGLERIELKE